MEILKIRIYNIELYCNNGKPGKDKQDSGGYSNKNNNKSGDDNNDNMKNNNKNK